MKNTKKLLALILALILTFTCAACGDPESTKSSSKKPKQTTPSSTGSQMTGSLPEEFTTQATSTEPEHNIATEATQPKQDEATDSTEPTPSQPRPNGVACTDIVLSSTIIEFANSERSQLLSVSLTPSNTTDKVTFTSLNTAVATVTDGGLITPVGTGNTVIRVTCGNVTKECLVYCSFGNADTEPTEPSEPKENEVTEPSQPAEDMADNYFFNDTNYAYVVNELSIKPRYVYWQEDGTLVAECFVINGFSHAVYNIEVKTISFANADGLIASANFGALKDLVLGPYQYCVKVFSFPPDCVSNFGASLASLTCNASTSFWY